MRTLVSALDWGLGHTTRIIPLIFEMLDRGEDLVLAGTVKQEIIYKEFFPNTSFVSLPSKGPVYSKSNSQIVSLLKFIPGFIYSSIYEYYQLKKLIPKHQINKVVSDNRYGLFNKQVKSIIICHQLRILLPKGVKFLEPLVNWMNCRQLSKFDSCWIPDYKGENSLAGKLSQPMYRIDAEQVYLGALSRFKNVTSKSVENLPKVLVVISGPENQRSVFEQKIIQALESSLQEIDYLIIRGLPSETINPFTKAFNHCASAVLKTYLLKSKYIICRSGYSSIMDLVALNKTALLIPTPGQPEQEYLANYLSDKKQFRMLRQADISTEQIENYLVT